MAASVMLVEDDLTQRRLLKQWIEAQGNTCFDFGTVDEATEHLRKEATGFVPRIDILLLDLDMGNGKFSGLEVLKETPPRIKRVVISGFSPEDVRAHVDPLVNVPFYFAKPLTKDDFAQLRHVIDASTRE